MAKSIMVQGTCSNAGKSLITAGLCRIFAQDGYKTAPFKSQNMALNSFITKDGFEIGRAQAVQAECAYKEIDVRFNPILLKPTGNKTSQVIINGKVYGNMTAEEYYREKHKFLPYIKESYDSLSKENHIIVIEGAGSPAEINLLNNDFVNMGLAELVNAPVILVGDIDRGGVFASIYGTVELLKEYNKYFKGFIINKFRGDINILTSGLNQLEDLTGKEVLGVMPYERFMIDEEDSLSSVFENQKENQIDIGVILLPRISNFTDFSVFDYFDDVSIRYIKGVSDFHNPDLLIIPGTKNTIEDMKYLRSSGLISKIIKYAEKGGSVIGICGGYQMLCKTIHDPYNIEAGGSIEGLGLINGETVFEKTKVTTQVSGVFENIKGEFSYLNGASFNGYEIHMGKTNSEMENIAKITDNYGNEKKDGLCYNNILGTYVHGVFDKSDVSNRIIEHIRKNKGLQGVSKIINIEEEKDKEYNRLAKIMRENLDVSKIYNILEKGV